MVLSTLLLTLSLYVAATSAQFVHFVPASQLMSMGGPRVVMAPMFFPGGPPPGMPAGLGSMTPGMGQGMSGVAPGMTGMDMSQTGMGMSQFGMSGMSPTGMDMTQTGMSQTGLGMSQTGLGMSQTGMGMSQAGLGMPGMSWDPMSQGQGGMWNQGAPYTVGQDMNSNSWGSAFGPGAMTPGMPQVGVPGSMAQPGSLDQASTGSGVTNPSVSLVQGAGSSNTGQNFPMTPDGFTNPGQTPTGRRR